MKKCSTSLAIKHMQMKTTLRFHLIPVRMVIFNSKNNKCWLGLFGWDGKREPLFTVEANVN
jgi:hypothetical protein